MRLIDAEALMKYCNNLRDKTIDANDIARFPTARGWISINEKIPEIDTPVLVFTVNNEILVWTFRDDPETGYCWDSEEGGYWAKLNEGPYWMPLPEPPEE